VLRNILIVAGALIQNVGGLLALTHLRRLRLGLTRIHAALRGGDAAKGI